MLSKRALWTRIVGFGGLVWLLPFVAGFFVIDRTGQYTIDIFVAKSMFMLIGSIVGAYLLFRLFKRINDSFLRWGILIGASWMTINWILDIVILLPLSGDSIATWFGAIGVRYLNMLIVGVLVGAVAQHFATAK